MSSSWTTMVTTLTPVLSPATASGCTASNYPLPRRSRITLQPTPSPWPSRPVFPRHRLLLCAIHSAPYRYRAPPHKPRQHRDLHGKWPVFRISSPDKWPRQEHLKKSLENDLGRIAQGVGTRMPTGTNTVFFIPCSAISGERTFTYS